MVPDTLSSPVVLAGKEAGRGLDFLSWPTRKGVSGRPRLRLTWRPVWPSAGSPTLLIDMDPQCNATSGLGRQPTATHPLVEGVPLRQAISATDVPNLELLPGSRSYRDVEAPAKGDQRYAARLREQLVGGCGSYDFVLIDCPPSLGSLTQTALASSSEVLMPIQCEYFAMEGLAQMIGVIREVMQQQPSQLQFGGSCSRCTTTRWN